MVISSWLMSRSLFCFKKVLISSLILLFDVRELRCTYFGEAATLAEYKRVKTREHIGANFAV